jgi:glycerol-3-phosphate acyltransferase PlsX
MIKPVRIALDAMGGDHGPEVIVPVLPRARVTTARYEISVFGDAARSGRF